MALTIEQQEEIKRRNAEIYTRYCNIAEQQPLAYPNTIFAELAKIYELSPQMIGLIVRTAQKETQQ